MKFIRIVLLALGFSFAASAIAQPPRRRAQMEQQKEQKQNAPKGSSYREFPTAQPMPEYVHWRRDLYRSLDLTKEANAVLYYPTTPQDGRENLFSYLFKMVLRKQVKAYDYKLDGNEDFSAKNEVSAKELMDRYHIFYESKGTKVRVNDADLPTEEVKTYFVKESTYYDPNTASFRSQVTALCPVLVRGETDFGGELAQYPMFWVKMADVAPYLGKLMLMSSSLNNAAMVSADDFFTMGMYEGEIYKAVNLSDKLIANYCQTDSAVTKEQKRIEKQLTDVQEHVYGRDSLYYATLRADSIVQAQADSLAALPRHSRSSRRGGTPSRRTSVRAPRQEKVKSARPAKQAKAMKSKVSKPKASSPSRGGGLSVRRQRH